MAEAPQLQGKGPMSGRNIIGEVTESLHSHLLENYDIREQPPRFEEDLSFVPKDREEVIYVYMYRVAQNSNLLNQKRFRVAPVFLGGDGTDTDRPVYYHRPPILLDLFYLVMVHSRFKSDAERLLGWVLLQMHEATHLIYRPRKFLLPDGREVDSLGRAWKADPPDHDQLFMEKVSVSLVDDLTVGDVINLYTLHEAPYRPFLTYRARVALDGPLVASSGGAAIKMGELGSTSAEPPQQPGRRVSKSGRIMPDRSNRPEPKKPLGPEAHGLKRQRDEPESEK